MNDERDQSLGELITDTPLVDLPVLLLAGVIWLVSTLAGPLIFVAIFQLSYNAARRIKGWITP